MVLRTLFWRLLAIFALLVGFSLLGWISHGGPAALLGDRASTGPRFDAGAMLSGIGALGLWVAALWSTKIGMACLALAGSCAAALTLLRLHSRRRRRYVRLAIGIYRTDRAGSEALVTMFETLHKRVLRRRWQRTLLGQPAVSLEVHYSAPNGFRAPAGHGSGAGEPDDRRAESAWFAICCERGAQRLVESALRAAYANSTLAPAKCLLGSPPAVLRLRKARPFVVRAKAIDRFEQEREPAVNRLLNVMGACAEPAFVQLALTPAPPSYERLARHLFRRQEDSLRGSSAPGAPGRGRSMIDDAELRGALDLQNRCLFFTDIRVVAPTRQTCERIASELCVQYAENRLVEAGTALSHGLLGLYTRRVVRGEGNPLPDLRRGVFASTELASLWQLPSVDYAAVPLTRSGVPVAPAPPAVFRPTRGNGVLRDRFGPVSIHPGMRRQNTAVAGTVEQGKTSFLAATVAEDLLREHCAVIVLDPKGDAAEVAVGMVPTDRTCTVLDFANPTCGFNPLAVDAPADVIADYVVAALKNLFSDAGAIFRP